MTNRNVRLTESLLREHQAETERLLSQAMDLLLTLPLSQALSVLRSAELSKSEAARVLLPMRDHPYGAAKYRALLASL